MTLAWAFCGRECMHMHWAVVCAQRPICKRIHWTHLHKLLNTHSTHLHWTLNWWRSKYALQISCVFFYFGREFRSAINCNKFPINICLFLLSFLNEMFNNLFIFSVVVCCDHINTECHSVQNETATKMKKLNADWIMFLLRSLSLSILNDQREKNYMNEKFY